MRELILAKIAEFRFFFPRERDNVGLILNEESQVSLRVHLFGEKIYIYFNYPSVPGFLKILTITIFAKRFSSETTLNDSRYL